MKEPTHKASISLCFSLWAKKFILGFSWRTRKENPGHRSQVAAVAEVPQPGYSSQCLQGKLTTGLAVCPRASFTPELRTSCEGFPPAFLTAWVTFSTHMQTAESSPFTGTGQAHTRHLRLGFKGLLMSHHTAQIKNKNVGCRVTWKLHTRQPFGFQNLVPWTHLFRIQASSTLCPRPSRETHTDTKGLSDWRGVYYCVTNSFYEHSE